MINKKMTAEPKRRLALHDSFITMLSASIRWPGIYDAGEIIAKWWKLAFPNNQLTEEELNDTTIDRIRHELLKQGGVLSPVLRENNATRRIKQSIIFTERDL